MVKAVLPYTHRTTTPNYYEEKYNKPYKNNASLNRYPQYPRGRWNEGYVLGLHSFPDGKCLTPLGEAMHRFKYDTQISAFMKNAEGKKLANTAVNLIKDENIKCDVIVPVPPSNKSRSTQPVPMLAKWIGQQLSWRVADCVRHTRSTGDVPVKVIPSNERSQYLRGLFKVESTQLKDRDVLLLDDVYDTGATANAVARAIFKAGARSVVFLAMTATQEIYYNKYDSDSDSSEDYHDRSSSRYYY